ncbi:MAG: glycosyltransferase family 4 protein [Jatrophihabitans endophyticus]|nr:glycosyltransferase family 4 protein [Jatrophihabitans endophyticus]
MLETVSGFVAGGWRVVVTMPGDGPLTEQVVRRGGETVVCPTAVLRKSFLRGLGPFRLLGAVLRSLLPMLGLLRRVHPDVVWVNTITVPLWPLVGRLTGHRVVTHAHEAEDGVAPVLRRALALPLSLAQVVIVNSDATGRSLAADGIGLTRRIRRIYNGVDGPQDASGEPAPTPRPGAPLRLLYVGRLSERKGPDLLVDAAAVLVGRGLDVQLELVGSVFPGYEPYERSLHDAAERAGVAGRVQFTGFLPSVWPAYRRSDIAFVPSRVEPLGNTAVEAMLAGVPLVTTRVGGLIEVTGNGRYSALVAPDDVEALVGAVETMLLDWPATQARALDARRSALERFSVEGYRAEVLAVGEQQAHTHRGEPRTVETVTLR